MLRGVFSPCRNCLRQRTVWVRQSARPVSSGDRQAGEAAALLRNAVSTDDDPPDRRGPAGGAGGRVRKPRHPPKTPAQQQRQNVDLSARSVLLFPGQGAQFVGMGKQLLEVPSVKELYEEASQVLDYNLLKLCLDGPQAVLDRTQYCQAATVVTSLAAVELLFRQDAVLSSVWSTEFCRI